MTRGLPVRRARDAARLCAAALLPVLLWPAAHAGAVDHTTAVALFYATLPLAAYSGVVPEEYASTDMSARLAAASQGRLTVVPRAEVQRQERSLRWREPDVLRFARLGELARAVGADRVVVGWIQELALEHFGGGGNNIDIGGGEGGGLLEGLAVMTVQIFDAEQGRIVYQTQVAGHAMGSVTGWVIQSTLDDAVRRGAAQLIGPLTAGAGAP